MPASFQEDCFDVWWPNYDFTMQVYESSQPITRKAHFVVDSNGSGAMNFIVKNFKNTPEGRPSIENRITN